jgi:hypothetical protein
MNAWLRLGLGLLLTPLLVGLAIWISPRVQAGAALGSCMSFAGAAAVAIAGLALAVTAAIPGRIALWVGVTAITALGTLAYWQFSNAAALIGVDAALVGLAWALGASLGRRVQHASHLFPACVVAASADVVSLLSPEGPSHAVAKSERALSVLAIWFPVPGSSAIAPALGVGDLLFVAFVLGVASAHQLDYTRAIACCALGVAVAGCAAAWLSMAFPALVPIAAATIIGLPSIRRLRTVDRRAAHASMLIAVSIAVAALARSAVSH